MKNYKKHRESIIAIFQTKKKLKKANYANIKNKNMSHGDREIRKTYLRQYYYKRKSLLNQLVNRVEELENVCLNK